MPDMHEPVQPFPATAANRNRRESFRVAGGGLPVLAWRMDPYDRLIDRPRPSRKISFTISNVGRRGLGGIAACDCLHLGDRVRIELPTVDALKLASSAAPPPGHDYHAVLIEGRVVYAYPLADGSARVGLMFVDALSETMARRTENALDRLLAHLQREAIRRSRNDAA
jgi:hypothetical protein